MGVWAFTWTPTHPYTHTQMPTLVLASASPRRRELLALTGWNFEVRPVNANETPFPDESPADFVRRLSETKARLAADESAAGALIIGADTIVVLAGEIIGKPDKAEAAVEMLKRLRGRTHKVFTGLTVFDTRTGLAQTELVCSRVPMRDYSDEEIRAYVATGDPLDKAGAYAIQHFGFRPVDIEHFSDCVANVMGLPLCHLLPLLRGLGLAPPAERLRACQNFVFSQCPVFENILKEEAA
jgi:septum formation protein